MSTYCHRRSLVLAFWGGGYGERGNNGGLGAVPPAGSRGRAPGQGIWGIFLDLFAPLQMLKFYTFGGVSLLGGRLHQGSCIGFPH